MKFSYIITSAVLASSGALAGDYPSTCDVYKWHPHDGYGGPKQCAPGGYYQSQDYPECSDQGSLSQKCDEYCNKDNSCGGYVAYLNKYKSSYRGKCHYYKQRPSNPQHCDSGYPSQIYCRYRSPILQCFYQSKDAAKKYCSSKLVTTETAYKTVTPTKYATTTYTPTTTKTQTTTVTTCDKYRPHGGNDYPYGHNRREEQPVAARDPIPAPAMITNEIRNDVPPPACLGGYNYKPEKITSACSCIGVTPYCTTVTKTDTAYPVVKTTTATAYPVIKWTTVTSTVTKCGW